MAYRPFAVAGMVLVAVPPVVVGTAVALLAVAPALLPL